MRLLLLILSTSFLFDQFVTCNSQYTYCSSDLEFLCSNNYCIYSEYQCDWIDDCGDLSDETQCEDVPAGCGGVLHETTGTILSPRYPLKYPNSARCTWIIEGPEQSTVVLNVSSFVLEEDCYDWLEFRETTPLTPSDSHGTEGVFWCGSGEDTFESSGNYLWLQFVSDSNKREIGFAIDYRIVTTNTKPNTDTVTTMRTTIKQSTTNGEKEISVSTKEVMVPTIKEAQFTSITNEPDQMISYSSTVTPTTQPGSETIPNMRPFITEKETSVHTNEVMVRTIIEDRLTPSLKKLPATSSYPDEIISNRVSGTIILGTSVGVVFLFLFVIFVGCIAYFRFRKKRSDTKPPTPQNNQLAFDGPYDTTVGAGQSSFFNENAQDRFNERAGNHVNDAFETDNIGTDDIGIYHDINDGNNEYAYATPTHLPRQYTANTRSLM